MAEEKEAKTTDRDDAPTLEDYEHVFRRIKEATGVSDVNEVIQKFLMQGETRENLVTLAKEVSRGPVLEKQCVKATAGLTAGEDAESAACLAVSWGPCWLSMREFSFRVNCVAAPGENPSAAGKANENPGGGEDRRLGEWHYYLCTCSPTPAANQGLLIQW